MQDDFVRALWDVTAGDALRTAGAGATAAQAQALLARLAKNLASPLTIATLAEEMGVDSPHTARARLQDLVFAYLVWPCHRRQGDLPRLSSQAKYYFVDPLMARLAALRSAGTALEPDSSVLTEQQLGVALLRSVEREQPGGYAEFSSVMYQRTSSKEVDFSGPRLGALGFEGKYVDAGWRQEAKTVRAAFGTGVLATRGLIDTSGDVWAVPAPFVAWMLDA